MEAKKGKTSKWLVSLPPAITAIVLMPWVVIVGIALRYPEITVYNVFGVGRTLSTALFHMNMGFFLPIFIVQFFFGTSGSKADHHYKSMIKGYHQAYYLK